MNTNVRTACALCDYVMHAREWCTNKLHSCSHAVPLCSVRCGCAQNTVMHRQSTWFTFHTDRILYSVLDKDSAYSLICAQQMPMLWTEHKWALGAHIFQRKVFVLRTLCMSMVCLALHSFRSDVLSAVCVCTLSRILYVFNYVFEMLWMRREGTRDK